jgi:predicted AAA+ superfamily ATPase
MFRRLIKVSKNNSLFLFGPRGTGKSTVARQALSQLAPLKIDLLTDEDETRFSRSPDDLLKIIAAQKPKWVLIDEVQKIPKLLDLVHLGIEERGVCFFLTGSSARKLRRAGANLLAGRAFTYMLHPLTFPELGSAFDLEHALSYGSLPKVHSLESIEEKRLYLNSYCKTYLTEEIVIEQAVRKVDQFKEFLGVAAQCNGKVLNYSRISRDIGSTDKTVKEYFQILADTLIGFKLPAFHRSIRKSQKESPKFYLFDPGVKRALERTLSVPLVPETFAFGDAFEHWVVLEVQRMNDYFQRDFRFSFFRTDHVEVDLVIERPGQPELLVEIKSTSRVMSDDVGAVAKVRSAWDRPVEAQVWSLDPRSKIESGVTCLHWQQGLTQLFPEITSWVQEAL